MRNQAGRGQSHDWARSDWVLIFHVSALNCGKIHLAGSQPCHKRQSQSPVIKPSWQYRRLRNSMRDRNSARLGIPVRDSGVCNEGAHQRSGRTVDRDP